MDKKELFQGYKKMRLLRYVEEYIADIYNNQPRPMHTAIHLYTGEEAIAVGVCNHLKKTDMIFSTHRNHGHYLAKGGDLKKMMAELYGKKSGCCHGKGASMHLTDVENGIAPSSAIVAGNVSIATGFALSQKIKKTERVAVSFFGDGASEEGSVMESVSFAAIHKLPILYVIENNLYAINTPLEAREVDTIVSKKFEAIIDVRRGDGNNLEEVDDIVRDAMEKVRSGKGPVLVEFFTYRWHGHDGINDGACIRYRTKEEIEKWRRRDPIRSVQEKLIELDECYIKEIEEYEFDLKQWMMEAVEFAEKSPFPEVSDLYSDFVEN